MMPTEQLAQAGTPRLPPWRSIGWSFVEFVAITGIAIAQPLFGELRIHAEDEIISKNPGRLELVALTFLVVLAPAVVLLLVELLVAAALPRARTALHRALVASVAGLVGFELIGNLLAGHQGLVIVAGIAVAFLAFLMQRRWAAVSTFLRFLAFAPIVFAFTFLTSPAIMPMIRTGNEVATGPTSAERPHRVVMIVADELPLASLLDGSGHIDRGLYPNIAALADDSRWYRNTTTVAPHTKAAVPAIVTGSFPRDPRALANSPSHQPSIFSLLGSQYAVNAHESGREALCPRNVCPTSGSLRGLTGSAVRLWRSFASVTPGPGPCVCDPTTIGDGFPNGREFVASIEPSSEPRFDYLHVLLPHSPWVILPSGTVYDTQADSTSIPAGLDTRGRWRSKDAALQARQRQLLQLQALDTLIGRITGRLRAIGAYDDSVIVFTADHGSAFTPLRSRRAPVPANFHEVLWVPLLVKQPGNIGGGEVSDERARNIDILPTVADLIGLAIPRTDGGSLLRPTRELDDLRVVKLQIPGQRTRHGTVRFSRRVGFARVLATPAVSPGVSDELRVYGYGGAGSFAGLVGQSPAPYLRGNFADAPGWLRQVDVVRGNGAPWVLQGGTLITTAPTRVAVVVNGTIAGLTVSGPDQIGRQAFTVVLNPRAFHEGTNAVGFFAISGSPSAPMLTPIGTQVDIPIEG